MWFYNLQGRLNGIFIILFQAKYTSWGNKEIAMIGFTEKQFKDAAEKHFTNPLLQNRKMAGYYCSRLLSTAKSPQS